MQRTRLNTPELYRVAAVQSLCALCYALALDEGIPHEPACQLLELAEKLRTQVIPPWTPEPSANDA